MIGLLLLLSILLLPIVGFPVALISATKVNTYKYSRVLILAFYFGIIGFFFIPKYGTDLSRYFEGYVDVLRGTSFPSVVHSMEESDFFFIVQKSLFFFVSRFQTDQLLPAITLFIIYFTAFTIIVKYARKNTYTRNQTFTTFLFMLALLPLVSLVNNVRNIIAVAFFCLGLYLELEEGEKIRSYLLYVLAMSMHVAVVPLILIKIVINLLMNLKKRKIFFNLMAFSLLIGTTFILFRFGIIDTILTKGSFYYAGGTAGTSVQQWFSESDKSLFQQLSKYLGGLVCSAIIALTIKELVSNTINNDERSKAFMNKELMINIMIYSTICLFFVFRSGTTWFRFYFIELFYGAIYYRYSLNQENKNMKAIIELFWVAIVITNIFLQFSVIITQPNIQTLIKNITILPIYQLLKQG